MPRLFTLVSFAVHVAAVALVLIAQTLDVGRLPTPHIAIAFDDTRMVKIADIPLPSTRPAAAKAVGRLGSPAVPLAAPPGIAPESPTSSASLDADRGLIGGIEGGGPGLGAGVVPGAGLPPPPQPTPTNPTPFRLHSGIQPPRKIVDVAPEYPALARAVRQQGVVILETIIDVQGNVETVHVLRGYPLLNEAAVTAVRQWQFTPALLNGQPIPVVMTVTVNFFLQ